MENIDKLQIINNRINNIMFHIDILEKDILENPDSDIPGKQPRYSVLQDLISKKEALEAELAAIDSGQ